jgi:hypothetical protein
LSAHPLKGEGALSLFKDIVHMAFGGSSAESKSQSSSESGNKAYPYIQSTFGGTAGQTGSASSAMGNVLGLGGSDAMSKALDDYYNSAGGQFQLGQGLDALTSKYSALGLTHSGAAMKGMEEFRQGLASTYLDNYLNHLNELGQLGLGAGGLIANAGQFSNSQSTSKSSSDQETGGLGKFIGAIMASDRGLKTNITLLRRDPDGLGWYSWNWKSDPNGPTVTGVIADEVEKIRPWAFVKGFVNGIYHGVNYAALGAA